MNAIETVRACRVMSRVSFEVQIQFLQHTHTHTIAVLTDRHDGRNPDSHKENKENARSNAVNIADMFGWFRPLHTQQVESITFQELSLQDTTQTPSHPETTRSDGFTAVAQTIAPASRRSAFGVAGRDFHRSHGTFRIRHFHHLAFCDASFGDRHFELRRGRLRDRERYVKICESRWK